MYTTSFVDWNQVPVHQLSAGVRIRTPYGRNIMLSLVEIDEGAVVPTHSHPHEQAGLVLEGRMEFTIGEETRILSPGQAYMVPSNVPHRAASVGGTVKVLDIFSPVRDDYARRDDRYIFRADRK